MKIKNLLFGIVGSSILSTAAYAQVEVTVTGSTAFRPITFDRVRNLFDPPSLAVVTNTTDSTTSANQVSYRGTLSNAVPSLGATIVTIRTSFSGSAAGMLAVKNQTPQTTAEFPSGTVSKVADLALSDVFPGSATPPIAESAFNRTALGVVPFVFVKNNSLAGINNVTRDQAVLLMTASGDGGMPATFLGGSSVNPVYLVSRDSGSGTRISVERDIGFTGSPLLWATNGAGVLITTNGYSSGSAVRAVLNGVSGTIGYLGLGDYAAITNGATSLTYDGIAYSPATVSAGSYALWGYEHLVNRVGGLSANQTLVRNALIAAITDPTFQNGNTLYNVSFLSLNSMQVERGADGGVITSKNF